MEQLISLVSGKVARTVFGLIIALFGVFHMMYANMMAGAVPVPGGVIWVYFTGFCLIAGAVGIITNFKGQGRNAAFLTGVLVLVFAFGVQLLGVMRGGENAMMYQTIFLKDIMIAMGAWVIAGTFR